MTQAAVIQPAPPGAGGVSSRLLRGFGAASLGPVVTAIGQVILVPVCLHSWGGRAYGEWLMVSAVPAYLALSDMGFGSVAANDMTIRVAAGDRKGALVTFQSAWTLVTAISLFLALIAVVGAIFGPTIALVRFNTLSGHQLRSVVVLLSLYALVSLQNAIAMGGFRCTGRFATGTILVNSSRLAETVAVTCVVACGGSPVAAASAYLAARIFGTLALALVLVSSAPWLSFGFRHARLSTIRGLVSPAFAFMAFPAANAISLQGLLILVGTVLGPDAVAVFSTMRTLTRVPMLIVEAVKNSSWQEFSVAYGTGNWSLARKLHRSTWQVSLLLCVSAAAMLAVFGPQLYRFWTHGQLGFQTLTFYLLIMVTVCNSLWNASSVVSLAANRHQRLALLYLGGTLASLVIGVIGMWAIQLPGAALGLLIVDLAMAWFVMRDALKWLRDRPADFLSEVLNFKSLYRRIQTILRRVETGDPSANNVLLVETAGKTL